MADNSYMVAHPSTDLPADLLEHMRRIKEKAREYGLDFYDVVFEKLDFDTMNQIAAYGGFPTRYPHWKWGMEFEKLSMQPRQRARWQRDAPCGGRAARLYGHW